MWENIPQEQNTGRFAHTVESQRLRVPDGWLIRTIVSRGEAGVAVTQSFIADRQHLWNLHEK